MFFSAINMLNYIDIKVNYIYLGQECERDSAIHCHKRVWNGAAMKDAQKRFWPDKLMLIRESQ